MLVDASYAIASLVEEDHLKQDDVIPKVNPGSFGPPTEEVI
jgi:hypothetical protein